VDASERSGGAGSGWDGTQGGSDDDVVVGQWPDGTAITDSECRAPDDARELSPDVRRYFREARWARRRAGMASLVRVLGSPRAAIAVVLLAALIASAVAILLPAAR
jgi:hypothetical protein